MAHAVVSGTARNMVPDFLLPLFRSEDILLLLVLISAFPLEVCGDFSILVG